MARVALSAGIAIAGTTAAHAAVWTGSAQGGVHAGYDDNVRLSVNALPATVYDSADLGAHLALQNETVAWSLDPRISVERYRNYHELDRTDTFINTAIQQQSETSQSSLAVGWTRDTTLTSELGLTGLAEVNKHHEATSVTLAHVAQWTERFDTQSQVFITGNRYMDAGNTGLVNYNYGAADIAFGYALNERSRLSLDGSIGRLDVPGFSLYGKTNQSIMLSYSVSFAERWQGKFSAGPSQVRSEFSRESGTVYEFSLNRKSETSTLQLRLSRDITPTGQGVLTRRKQITLSATRSITQRLTATLNGSQVQNDSLLLFNSFNFYGVRYSDVNASLSWAWTPTCVVSLSAGHTEQRLDNSEAKARRNYVSLGVSWNGLTHTLH
ncbi:MAG TPA: hypothetical protein VG962_08475 [Steroidobacteraceae bacterium]|nr:hypothetical protein [Steroidobacteraceae bacterium]